MPLRPFDQLIVLLHRQLLNPLHRFWREVVLTDVSHKFVFEIRAELKVPQAISWWSILANQAAIRPTASLVARIAACASMASIRCMGTRSGEAALQPRKRSLRNV
jgi:hypothetical protein